ncbi:MAG: gliding motility-associated C-terminal domain-containing protein [Crocinitomicaceae bacterium]|nr:gliding motility-associated C-terminal domain-containing protein [Crocinitomicaceae bacterium]
MFSQKLGNYEAPVNPELWAKISSQVAAGATTTAATGLSVFAKVAIGLGISAAAITTVVILSSSPEDIVSEEPAKEVQKETPTSTTESNKEQVAELDQPEVIESMDNDNSGTVEAEMPLMYRSSNIEVITDPDFVIPEMEIKNPEALSQGAGSEREIVEVITYSEVTQYGSTTEEVEEIITEEPVAPKVEPIKRFVNVFTPNGDNENDEFFLESEGLTDFSVVVFNPNGDIVFQSNDSNFRWDGRDIRTGDMVASGNYMYMVSAYDSEGNPYPIYERLTIKF